MDINIMAKTKAAVKGGMVGLLLFAGAAIAQEPPAQTEKDRVISYAGGQLTINTLDSTLADILAKVADLTGLKIDVPASANSERMAVVELGPGPARQILASLLSGSNLDYVIQASDTDPAKIQSVLLLPRDKRGSGPNGTAAPQNRGPYARAGAPPEEPPPPPPAPEIPVPAQPENAAADPNSQPALTQLEQQPTQPDQSNLSRPGALAPPQSMTPETINTQLQQMYQQRMQMIQQGQPGTPPPPSNPGPK
jgi:hypothetical protein